jgi:hypothetical protein
MPSSDSPINGFKGPFSGKIKELVPIVKLGEPFTYAPWTQIPCRSIVVRMQDLLRPNGQSFRGILQEIDSAGGIHQYLNFPGSVLLSMIMTDKRIYGCTPARYCQAINTLKPDFYTTVDAETYTHENELSYNEINRALNETKHILENCPTAIPIGLVKGATKIQVEKHIEKLKEMGIDRFLFHAGDFLCGGKKESKMLARDFARIVHREDEDFIVYGIGAKRTMRMFGFAGSFITQSHYIAAFNGWNLIEGKWVRRKGKVTRENIMHNLKEIHKIFQESYNTGGLKKWVGEKGAEEAVSPSEDQKIKALQKENQKH